MLPLNSDLESCWWQKLTGRTKIILHPKFERKRIKGRYYMAIWFFNKVVWFVLFAMLEVILLPSNMAAKTNFCLYLVKLFRDTLISAVNVTTSSFQQFPWSLSCKISVQKEAIHSFKNHILLKWPATNLLILRKWRGFEKLLQYYFV